MPYAEAIGLYGSDKPDLRFGLPLCDLTEVVRRHDGGGVEMFRAALASGKGDGVVKGWRLPAEHGQPAGPQRGRQAGGLRQGLRRARAGRGPASAAEGRLDPVAPQDHDRCLAQRAERRGRPAGGRPRLFLQFGARKLANTVLGALRLHLAESLGLIPKEGAAAGSSAGSPSFRCSRRPRTASWSPPTIPSPRPCPKICPGWRPSRRPCGPGPTISCSTATRWRAARSGFTRPTCRPACSPPWV